jgi:hypothetical protein
MKITLTTLIVSLVISIHAADEPLKPNILIIFTDDQGYADLACLREKKEPRRPGSINWLKMVPSGVAMRGVL